MDFFVKNNQNQLTVEKFKKHLGYNLTKYSTEKIVLTKDDYTILTLTEVL